MTYEMLPDPRAMPPTLTRQQVLMAPVPLETPLPEYPQQALADDAAPVTVVLRIILDESGVVRDVLDSPLAPPEEGSGRALFREGAAAAVRGWRFLPAVIRTLAEGGDIDHDGRPDYTVVTDEERVRSYLDLRFTFAVVDGRGQVKIGPGAP